MRYRNWHINTYWTRWLEWFTNTQFYNALTCYHRADASRDHGWSDRECKWEWESERVSKQAREWVIDWLNAWLIGGCNVMQCTMFNVAIISICACNAQLRSAISDCFYKWFDGCSLIGYRRGSKNVDKLRWLVWYDQHGGMCIINQMRMRAMFISETEFQSTESNNNSFTYTRVFLFK